MTLLFHRRQDADERDIVHELDPVIGRVSFVLEMHPSWNAIAD